MVNAGTLKALERKGAAKKPTRLVVPQNSALLQKNDGRRTALLGSIFKLEAHLGLVWCVQKVYFWMACSVFTKVSSQNHHTTPYAVLGRLRVDLVRVGARVFPVLSVAARAPRLERARSVRRLPRFVRVKLAWGGLVLELGFVLGWISAGDVGGARLAVQEEVGLLVGLEFGEDEPDRDDRLAQAAVRVRHIEFGVEPSFDVLPEPADHLDVVGGQLRIGLGRASRRIECAVVVLGLKALNCFTEAEDIPAL